MEKYIFEIVEVTRKGNTVHQKDEWKEALYAYPCLMVIGRAAEIPVNNGKILRTSAVKDFQIIGNYMTIETQNTIYHFRR